MNSKISEQESALGFNWGKKTTLEKVYSAVAVALCVYAILFVTGTFSKLGWHIMVMEHRAIIVAFLLVYIFLTTPATKKKGDTRNSPPWYDYLFILASLVSSLYLVVCHSQVLTSISKGMATNTEVVLAVVLLIAILEAGRRTIGIAMPIIAAAFLVYLFFSNHFPGVLFARPPTIHRAAAIIYLSESGIFGIPVGVAATIIIMFMIFSGVLLNTGASKFFLDLALSLFGHVRGGPAKVAVVASAGFGTLSGSVAANVASTGTITIPLMKSIGYRSHFAAAVECVASNGGAITPPVMASVVFIMSEWTRLSYASICLAAAIPALLYYIAVFVQVDLEAAKTGLKGLPRQELPSFWKTMKEGWVYPLALVGLVVFLIVLRYRPETAALYATGVLWAVGLLSKQSRIGPKGIAASFVNGAQTFRAAAIGCCLAGIIIGVLVTSGVGVSFSIELVALARGNLFFLLSLAAIVAFVMGMGVTVIAIYIILAALVAPAAEQMGVPTMASHLFLIYWAGVSFITPPVALAAFIAASIGKCSPWQTGWQACRLGIVTFIVPFMFVYNPALLLIGSPWGIAAAALRGIVAAIILGIGVEGYGLKSLNWIQRILILASGVFMLLPGWNTAIVGVAMLVPAALWHLYATEYLSFRRLKAPANERSIDKEQ